MPEEDNEQGTIRYVRCPSCGMPNPATSATCFRCGKSMHGESAGPAPQAKGTPSSAQTDVVCGKCKKVLPPGSKFCGFCGAPMPAPAPAPAPERAAAPAAPEAPPKRPQPAAPPPPSPATQSSPGMQPPGQAAKKTEPMAPAIPTPAASPQGTQIFSGLKVPKIDASIVEIKSDDSAGKTVRVVKETLIGRTGCDLSYPNDALLSQRHASLNKREGKLVLKDLGSQNGTFVKQRQDTEILPGDVFVLGRELFRFTTQRMEESPQQNVMGTAVMSGAPRLQPGPITAKLEHIQLSGDVVKEYSLDKPETTIGRTTGDLTFNDDPYMSGKHARIVAQPGHFILQDMKSRNGIYRRIRESATLQDGDEFFLGEERFRVDIKAIED